MRKILISVLAIALLLASSAYAYDNNRKGFVAGAGFGMSPMIHAKWEQPPREQKLTKQGLGVHLLVGYGFSESNVIVLERIFAGELNQTKSGKFYGLQQMQLFQVSLYHYFKELGNSPFLSIGVGEHHQNVYGAQSGTGFTLGGGLELTRRWQVGLYYIHGVVKSDGVKYTNQSLAVIATAIWK